MNYQKKVKDYDRIVVLHAPIQVNARRSTFINKKRCDIIEFINTKGKPYTIYKIILNEISEIIPNVFSGL